MLATTSNEDDPFWSQIYKAIDAARGSEVRVFIISSILVEQELQDFQILQEE